jgi:hypothetical protein
MQSKKSGSAMGEQGAGLHIACLAWEGDTLANAAHTHHKKLGGVLMMAYRKNWKTGTQSNTRGVYPPDGQPLLSGPYPQTLRVLHSTTDNRSGDRLRDHGKDHATHIILVRHQGLRYKVGGGRQHGGLYRRYYDGWESHDVYSW